MFYFIANFPIFTSKSDMEHYLKGTGSVQNALNYSRSIADEVISNDDLPYFDLDAIKDSADHFPDTIDGVIDDILNGAYSDENIPSYGDAREQTVSDAWDNVEQSTEAVPGEKDKPTDGDEDEKDADEPSEGDGKGEEYYKKG